MSAKNLMEIVVLGWSAYATLKIVVSFIVYDLRNIWYFSLFSCSSSF